MMTCTTLGIVAVVAAAGPELVVLLPIEVETGGPAYASALIEERTLAELGERETVRLVGIRDLNALLAAEQRKDLMGCEDVSCLAGLGGALGARRMVRLSVHRADADRWLLTAHLLDEVGAPRQRLVREARGDRDVLYAAAPALVRELLTRQPAPELLADPAAPRTAALRPYLSSHSVDRYERYADRRADALGLDAWVAETNSESRALFWVEVSLALAGAAGYAVWLSTDGDAGPAATVALGATATLPWLLIFDGMDLGNVELRAPAAAVDPHRAL